MKWKLYTFSRGKSINNIKQNGRSRDDRIPVKISDNSDFEIIIEGVVDYFVCENMDGIDKLFKETYKREYRNSRNKKGNNNREKYYNSTIVLPIRIENTQIEPQKGNCKNYHLLGFLCIDTLEPFSKEEQSMFYLGVEYAKAIADSMYHQVLNYFYTRINIANKDNKK